MSMGTRNPPTRSTSSVGSEIVFSGRFTVVPTIVFVCFWGLSVAGIEPVTATSKASDALDRSATSTN